MPAGTPLAVEKTPPADRHGQLEQPARRCRTLQQLFADPAVHPQVCRYLVKDFGTSQSPKSTRQRDSRYCP
ncbi:MAG: hypothetical protein AB2813_11850, partial [Candidatus Sedimenticola endophacoides]